MSLQDYIDTAIQNSPLSFFCDVKVIPGEIEQRREDLKSDIALTARLENRDLGSAAAFGNRGDRRVRGRSAPAPGGAAGHAQGHLPGIGRLEWRPNLQNFHRIHRYMHCCPPSLRH